MVLDHDGASDAEEPTLGGNVLGWGRAEKVPGAEECLSGEAVGEMRVLALRVDKLPYDAYVGGVELVERSSIRLHRFLRVLPELLS